MKNPLLMDHGEVKDLLRKIKFEHYVPSEISELPKLNKHLAECAECRKEAKNLPLEAKPD